MRNYLPPTSPALAVQIEEGFRGDFTPAGRALKAEGVDGRRTLRIKLEQAASARGERHG